MTDPIPSKLHVTTQLMSRGWVFVHMDTRIESVRVPLVFKKTHRLVLRIGRGGPNPIRDLNVDEEGFSGTLSFDSGPFFCRVPWSSVFAIVGEDGRGMIWEESLPPEALQESSAQSPPRTLRLVK